MGKLEEIKQCEAAKIKAGLGDPDRGWLIAEVERLRGELEDLLGPNYETLRQENERLRGREAVYLEWEKRFAEIVAENERLRMEIAGLNTAQPGKEQNLYFQLQEARSEIARLRREEAAWKALAEQYGGQLEQARRELATVKERAERTSRNLDCTRTEAWSMAERKAEYYQEQLARLREAAQAVIDVRPYAHEELRQTLKETGNETRA